MTASVRMLHAGDLEILDIFLKPHTPFAYFMRSNAKYRGLIYQGKPYQADYFGAFKNGELQGLLSHSWLGSTQIFALDKTLIPALADAWKKRLGESPHEITCFLGPDHQVKQLLSSLAVQPTALRDGGTAEKLFALSLDRLLIPDALKESELKVRRAMHQDTDILIKWRHDFYVEAIGDPAGKKTYDKASDEIVRRIGENDLFVLETPQGLASFCGAGGFLSDWKIVGPVWTPPEKRGCGYARAVTAGALAVMRAEGAQNAVLFAHEPAAERAYLSIGFQQIGDWRLDFLVKPALTL